jgi:Putative  PD-(D/E)XK family member, (DUF4420)
MKQMTNKNNPWEGMPESAQRRIDSDTIHNIFWITDLKGNYGFCLRADKPFADTKWSINLKGVEVLKRNSQEDKGELFLILTKKEDWQIFKVLCDDLIVETGTVINSERMIDAVEMRLKRWQQLLKHETHKELTIEIQMGLFAEMLCLRDLIAPKVGIKQAIICWVGSDFDKQDFLTDNSAIEVKSYRTSKGRIASISSSQQLSSEKESLFLLAFGLTMSETGQSIKEISESIAELLKSESNEISDLFESKLINYGYVPELIKEPLAEFIVDKKTAFSVTDEFPKIDAKSLKTQILSVKYTIDLSKCTEYEINPDSIIL